MVGSGKCGRVGNGSGRKRIGTGTGIPSVVCSRLQLPDPCFPTSVSVPTVNRPDLRHLVPVPAVSRPAVMCIPDFSRPAVRSVVPIPSRRSHTISPIHSNSLMWQMFPSHSPWVVYFSHHRTMYAWMQLDYFNLGYVNLQLWIQQPAAAVVYYRYNNDFFSFVLFFLSFYSSFFHGLACFVAYSS